LSLAVEFDAVHGEHTAVLRLPSGLVFCLVATPPYVPGFALLCGDPGSKDWEEALDVFLAQTPFERSAVTWVPSDGPGLSERPTAPGYRWKDGTGLLAIDDPGLVDAAFERGEPHAGVAVIGLALNHGQEPEPLLQALTDTHTAAEYHHRRKQRERAAEADKRRREAAERQRLDEEWARSEWFDKREKKMKKLARLWDEVGTADER
jgi:hypothetical protein